MTYTIYKSTDPDAPQLSNAAGALKTVLKACLVTGYGTGTNTKAGAGWNLLYDEPNKAVFQPIEAGAENLMLQIDDTPSDMARFAVYSAMTDVNTGTKVFDANRGYRRANATWFVVATAKWFWYFTKDSGYDQYAPLFFGNLDNLIPENQNQTVMMCPCHYGPNSFYASSLFEVGSVTSCKKSSRGDFELYTGFNAVSYNTATAGDLCWLDIIASDNSGVLGVVPLVKATPVNNGLANWHQVAPNVFALKVAVFPSSIRQIILDFSHVN